MTDKQREKIKQKIRSLRSKLSAEKRKYGGYDDSYGKRYIIAELYLKLGDYKLAKKYYEWFDREFPDDMGFPEFNFGRIRVLFESKKHEEGISQLIDLETYNTYLINIILDQPSPEVETWEWSNMATLEYAISIKDFCQSILSPAFKDWLKSTTSSTNYKAYKQSFIALQVQLNIENSIKERNTIQTKTEQLIGDWKSNV